MKLMSASLRGPLEKAVSLYKGRNWRVISAQDMSECACHPCAIISDGVYSVFSKYSEAPNAVKQFEIEQAGLLYLSEKAGVLIPTPIDIVPVVGGTLFIMEAIDTVERSPQHWRQIGRTLARIHKVKSEYFGFHIDNYFGPLDQDNTTHQDWTSFYIERRLKPRLKMAIDSGNLSSSVANQVEIVINRVTELCGPVVTPSLLHGDASQNNFISSKNGSYVIDPAIYYGNPEIDLAFIDYFQPVPEDVFDGYRDELPIDSGFYERRNLWRISGYLAAVAVEGKIHLNRLTNALQGYL
jgi:fructosamine-3-kinase